MIIRWCGAISVTVKAGLTAVAQLRPSYNSHKVTAPLRTVLSNQSKLLRNSPPLLAWNSEAL